MRLHTENTPQTAATPPRRGRRSLTLPGKIVAWTMGIAAAVFLCVMGLICYVAQERIKEAAGYEWQERVDYAADVIGAHLEAVETAVENVEPALTAGLRYGRPDSLLRLPAQVVAHTRAAMGASVAFARHTFPGPDSLLMLYACYDSAGVPATRRLRPGQGYDYTRMQWYAEPMATGADFWSDPYYDDGGGNMLMCTVSHPVGSVDGHPQAVITADVPLGFIAALVWEAGLDDAPAGAGGSDAGDDRSAGGDGSVCRVVSRDGHLIYHTDGSLVMRTATPLPADGALTFRATVPGTGWVVEKSVPLAVLMAPVRTTFIRMMLLSAVALLVLFAALRYAVKVLAGPEMRHRARLDAELAVAARVQRGMLPAAGSGLPPELECATLAIPAKEVGGDFYNYHTANGHVHFIIGDVSGKGVPAAIYMAVASELYGALAALDLPPQQTATRLNDMLCRNNAAAMFITAVIMRLDIATGALEVCCCGHTPPLLLRPGAPEPLTAVAPANLPLGVMEGMPFSAVELTVSPGMHVMLYTDGVTEAENAAREQFGGKALAALLAAKAGESARQVVQTADEAVERFTAGAEQNDDLTLLDVKILSLQLPQLILPARVEKIEAALAPLERLPLPEEKAMRVRLAAEEALANVALHSDASEMGIAATLTATQVTVIITDDGREFNPLGYRAAEPDPAHPAAGGQGIRLITSLAANVRYERAEPSPGKQRNILTLAFNLN